MKKPKSRFGIGRAGLECRFYLVRGFYNSTPRQDEQGKPTPFEVLRIGSDNLDDLMNHLKRFESNFDVHQIKLIGMMRVVSGTPYWG
jgi:hypothetical protein